MSDEKTGDVGVLVSEIEVYGYKIKPWGIATLSRLSPTLEAIVTDLKKRNVTLKTAEADIAGVIFSILPYAVDIVAVSLKISKEEVENIPAEQSPVILFTIISQNLEYLKNWFSPINLMVKKVVS
jgi:hypothetical protein